MYSTNQLNTQGQLFVDFVLRDTTGSASDFEHFVGIGDYISRFMKEKRFSFSECKNNLVDHRSYNNIQQKQLPTMVD
jgi:hypothetical protein